MDEILDLPRDIWGKARWNPEIPSSIIYHIKGWRIYEEKGNISCKPIEFGKMHKNKITFDRKETYLYLVIKKNTDHSPHIDIE